MLGKGTTVIRCTVCGENFLTYPYRVKNNTAKYCSYPCRNSSYTSAIGEKQYPFEYHCWQSLKDRCLNPNNSSYKNYGQRGIKVCSSWAQSFATFLSDIGPRPSKSHSIDRIDNNGDYSPDNVKWSLPSEQARNTRRTKFLTYNNKTLCLLDWSILLKIPWNTLDSRLRKGWSIEKTLTTP